jgi:CheY-like chemotaxis protein
MSHKFKVLVVEDDEDYVKIIYESLEYYLPHIEFTITNTGEKAIRFLAHDQYDIAIVDLDLRQGGRTLTGMDVLRELAEKYPFVEIIVITGTSIHGVSSTKSGTSTFRGVPVRDVIGKPVSIREMQQLIETIRENRLKKDST